LCDAAARGQAGTLLPPTKVRYSASEESANKFICSREKRATVLLHLAAEGPRGGKGQGWRNFQERCQLPRVPCGIAGEVGGCPTSANSSNTYGQSGWDLIPIMLKKLAYFWLSTVQVHQEGIAEHGGS
jgi:hypothetical protein